MVFLPAFNGMGKAHTVHFHISRLHFRGDPGSAPCFCSYGGTFLNNFRECAISGDLYRTVAEIALESFWDSEFVGKKDQPRVGIPPEQWVAVRIPGENAEAIGRNKSVWGEVTTYCQQAIFFCTINGRKTDVPGKLKNGHEVLVRKGVIRRYKIWTTSNMVYFLKILPLITQEEKQQDIN